MTSNNRPNFYGMIRRGTKLNHTDVGKIAVWKQNVPPASKQPPYSGKIVINGEIYYVAIWENIDIPTTALVVVPK